MSETTRNLYAAKRAPYYIFALDYQQQSAGIRALHYLCHALNESGQEAYVTCAGTAAHLRTPVLTENIMLQHHETKRRPIVVYPEIMSGDPLGAGGVVVRWLLNKPGLIAGDTEFPDSDLIFAYDMSYLPAGWLGKSLHVPTCDLAIFNNEDNPHDDRRDLTCFYAHKYLHAGGKLTPHVKDAVSLCKDQPLSKQEIANILRRAKVLYIYEQTALLAEALLCGCPVAVIDTDYWPNHAAPYVADWGVSYFDDSPEALALAKSKVPNYQALHQRLIDQAWQDIDNFIDITQQAMKK